MKLSFRPLTFKFPFIPLAAILTSALVWRARTAEQPHYSEEANTICQYVASVMAGAGLHAHCLVIIKKLLPYWQVRDREKDRDRQREETEKEGTGPSK